MGPHGYLPGTFQPTFLYECLWDLATFGLLLLIERKVRLRRGYLFAAYVALYTLGRFFTEYVRIDPAHRYLGLRLNDWTSVAVFAVAAGLLLWRGRPTASHSLVGQPLPAAVLAAERARTGGLGRDAGRGRRGYDCGRGRHGCLGDTVGVARPRPASCLRSRAGRRRLRQASQRGARRGCAKRRI